MDVLGSPSSLRRRSSVIFICSAAAMGNSAYGSFPYLHQRCHISSKEHCVLDTSCPAAHSLCVCPGVHSCSGRCERSLLLKACVLLGTDYHLSFSAASISWADLPDAQMMKMCPNLASYLWFISANPCTTAATASGYACRCTQAASNHAAFRVMSRESQGSTRPATCRVCSGAWEAPACSCWLWPVKASYFFLSAATSPMRGWAASALSHAVTGTCRLSEDALSCGDGA